MIKKKNRFSRKNFESLRKRMKSFRTKNFLFLFGKPRSTKRLFAAVISKKTDNSAVKRNQFRRRTYEIIRKNFINEPLNLICLYKGSKIPKDSKEIIQELLLFFEFFKKKGKNLLIKKLKNKSHE